MRVCVCVCVWRKYTTNFETKLPDRDTLPSRGSRRAKYCTYARDETTRDENDSGAAVKCGRPPRYQTVWIYESSQDGAPAALSTLGFRWTKKGRRRISLYGKDTPCSEKKKRRRRKQASTQRVCEPEASRDEQLPSLPHNNHAIIYTGKKKPSTA